MKAIFILLSLVISQSAYSTTAGDVQSKAKDAAGSAADYTVEQKQAFQKSMEENISSLKSEVSALKTKATFAKGDAQIKMNERIKQLEKRRIELTNKLATLKNSSGRSWSKLKSGMSSAWSKAKQAVSDAHDEMNKN